MPNRYSLTFLCAAFCAVLFAAAPAQGEYIEGEIKWRDLTDTKYLESGIGIVGFNGEETVLPEFTESGVTLHHLPAPSSEVTYKQYGVSVDAWYGAGMYVSNSTSQDITFAKVLGNFSWTANLYLNDVLVYTNNFSYNGVDVGLTDFTLGAGVGWNGQQFKIETGVPGVTNQYFDLLDKVGATPYMDLTWKITNESVSIYDAATGKSLQNTYSGLVYSNQFSYIGTASGGITILYGYETGSGSNATPEPATLLVFGTGLAGMCLAKARRANRKRANSRRK